MVDDGGSEVVAYDLSVSAPSAVDQEPQQAIAAGNASTSTTNTFTPTPFPSVAAANLLSSICVLAQPATPLRSPSLFFTSVHWSPDATCILTSAEDNILRLYDSHTLTSPEPSPTPALSVPLPAAVYAAGWYPLMQSAVLESALIVTAVRDQPVQLVSAWTGEQRASYIGLSDKDELVSGMSVCFSAGGGALYVGYDGHIRAFDTATPGLPYMTVPTATKGSNKRRRTEGQYGLIASLSTASDMPLLAAGSYSGQAALYDTHTLQQTLVLRCNTTGVSQVTLRPPLLFAGGRGRDSDILVFDVRHTRYELGRIKRTSTTQQRTAFDVSRGDGRWLVTGEGGGRGVGVFDLTVASNEVDGYVDGVWVASGDAGGAGEAGHVGSIVNGVSFHPLFGSECPYLATVTGSRQFVRYGDDSDTESESDSGDDGEQQGATADESARSTKLADQVSTLSLWQLQPQLPSSHGDG